MNMFICQHCGAQMVDFLELIYDPLAQEYLCPFCNSIDVIEIDNEELNKTVGDSNEL